MEHLQLYRKRIIPSECILLKDDVIKEVNNQFILTTWHTIHPKATFTHGSSCYLLNEGIKISKFYKKDGSLLYWYCDIVDYHHIPEKNTLIVTDLLADVIVYPDGSTKIMDIDELADALDSSIISNTLLSSCLRRLYHLLSVIHDGNFKNLASPLENAGL